MDNQFDSVNYDIPAIQQEPVGGQENNQKKIKIDLNNPYVIFALQLVTFSTLGYYILNQKSKAVAGLVYSIVFGFLGVGWIFIVLGALDALLLARRKQNGDIVESNRCEIHFLHLLPIYHGF